MQDSLKDRLREMLSGVDPTLLAEMEEDINLAVLKAKREATPKHEVGTPKDPAVQILASMMLKFMRLPDYRRKLFRDFGGDEQLSYEEIGTLVKVSRERVRQIYSELCPREYELERQDRRSPVGSVRSVG